MNNLTAAMDQIENCIATGLSHVRKQCDQEGKLNVGLLDDYQQVTSDLAVSTAEIQCARNYLEYADAKGDIEHQLASTFAAETLHNIRQRLARFPGDYGLVNADLDKIDPSVCGNLLSASGLESLGRLIVERQGDLGDRGLDEEKILMADTFRQFANDGFG